MAARLLCLVAVAMLLSIAAQAQVFKCMDAAGKVTYQDGACEGKAGGPVELPPEPSAAQQQQARDKLRKSSLEMDARRQAEAQAKRDAAASQPVYVPPDPAVVVGRPERRHDYYNPCYPNGCNPVKPEPVVKAPMPLAKVKAPPPSPRHVPPPPLPPVNLKALPPPVTPPAKPL